MPSLTLSDRLIWFAHCPKAGGTSVERLMVGTWGAAVGHLHWGWDLWWKRGGWREADPPCSPQHLTWEDALKALPREPDAVFAVVRDPMTRLVSEYRFQRAARRGTRAGRVLARLPFSLWARLMLGLVAKNPYAFDNHLRPQGDFVPWRARVFRLEDGLGPVADWLAQAAGRAPAGLPGHELAARPGGDIRLSAGDIRRVARVYSGDYARFGYPLPDPGGAPSERHARLAAGLVRLLLPLVIRLERCGRL